MPERVAVESTDYWIGTGRGKLFARRWAPTTEPNPGDPTFILFHDSLGSVELWRDFPEQLAAATNRRVVAYDRLGFGKSDPFPGTLPLSFTRDEAATSIPHLREALGIDAMIPFGHSVGGSMAIATAAAWPEHSAAAITESAQSFIEPHTLDGIRAAKASFAHPGRVERLARYHGDKARWVLEAWIETWLDPAFANWNVDEDAAGVRCPLLVLHGDRDEYGSLEHPRRIGRLAGGPTRVVIMDGVGHVPHREQPARVLAEITQFLRLVRGSG